MKKWITLQLVAVLMISMLTGCGNNGNSQSTETKENKVSAAAENNANLFDAEETETVTAENQTEVSVMALKGPTAMGMVKLMNDADNGAELKNQYTFSIAASIDEVTPALVQGKTDIAAVPANVASVFYNNTEGNIEVLAINTLGVLYIVENGTTIESVEDLKGRTIYASGKGATPEYALNYILSENGIDPGKDVTIEWKSEHTECLSAVMEAEDGIALLPQPFVTTAQAKLKGLRVVLDLTEEWDKLQESSQTPSALLTGVVVARKDFVEEHPEAVKSFLAEYASSVAFVNENVEEAAELVGNYGIVDAAVALKAIPECNITYIDGQEMKEKLSGYLTALYEQNPQAVGGSVPADDFYYAQ